MLCVHTRERERERRSKCAHKRAIVRASRNGPNFDGGAGDSLPESLPIRQITGIIADPAGACHFSRASRREPDELQEFQWAPPDWLSSILKCSDYQERSRSNFYLCPDIFNLGSSSIERSQLTQSLLIRYRKWKKKKKHEFAARPLARQVWCTSESIIAALRNPFLLLPVYPAILRAAVAIILARRSIKRARAPRKP